MNSANTKTNSPKITKKDLFRANWRWLWSSQICWNYERMMSTGYLYTMLPTIQKLYPEKEDRVAMMKLHNQFFNTNAYVGGFIVGMDMAIEEKEGRKAEEAIAGLKAGLMGSFAGVGDTIFGVILPTIFGSIASYMGLKGNPIGAIIWLIANFVVLFLRFALLPMGYSQGEKLIYAAGKVVLKAQSILDQIMPSLVPVLLVAVCYWLLGKKKMTSTKLIITVLIAGIILGGFGIIGK